MAHSNIRHRLLVAFIGLAVVPLLLAGILLGWQTYRQNLDDALLQEQEVARRVVAQASTYLEQLHSQLEGVVAYSDFATAPSEARERLLGKLLANREFYREVYFFPTSGATHIHLSNVRIHGIEEESESRRDLREVVRVATASRRLSRSLIFFDSENNEPVVLLAQPVLNVREGSVQGVLVAEARLKPVWRLLNEMSLAPGEDVYIVGNGERVIGHRNPSIVLRETIANIEAGQRSQQGLHGNKVLLAVQPLEFADLPLQIVAERDIGEAIQTAINNLLIIAGVILFTLLGAVGLGRRLALRISRPIVAVAETAQAIRKGDLNSRAPIFDDDEIGEMARAFNSMTGQLRDSLELQAQLNRAYRAVGQSNRAIAVARNETELFNDICRIVQEDCGYRMVWIGLMVDDAEQSVQPVAEAGYVAGYLQGLHVSYADNEWGRGPTGRAIRERRAVVLDDIAQAAEFAPWRESARQRGYAAGAAFPIKSGEVVLGALMAYSAKAHAFSREEVALLGELAENCAFGILKLRAEEELEQHREHLEELVAERTRELSHQQTFSTAVLENISDGIVACDADGTLSLFNRATREMHGIGQEELSPEQWAARYKLFHADGKTLLGMTEVPLYRAFMGESFRDVEFVIERVDGKKLSMNAAGQPMFDRDGAKIGAVVSMRDMTLQKAAQQALVEAKEAAEAANEAKSSFLANMSHELRTPINAVLGMLYLALRHDLPLAVRTKLSKAQGAARSLLGLINDILDLSKIEAGKLELEQIPFGLDSVVERLNEIVAPQATEKGLEFLVRYDVAIPAPLLGDPLRISQVLINLCGNAVKFTEQGEIELAFHADQMGEGELTVRICVRDTGIGVATEQQPHLFQKFIQADHSTTRRFGGSGLGLAISKTLVEMMGGTIWLERSRPGEGTTLCFSVPLGIAPEARLVHRSEVAQKAGPLLKGVRVLVVDDNPLSCEILAEMLHHFHIDVATVQSGQEALVELEGHPYDLVLIDWRMPGMSGDETIRKLRRDAAIAVQPKVIMVTAYGREDVLVQAEQVGVDGFMVKPVSPSMLLDTLLTALGRDRVFAREGEIPLRSHLSSNEAVAGARLLLVEDNEINREFAGELLRSEGCIVDEALDGAQALAMVQERDYDLVLMDIQMPVMDGLEATRRIRALAHSAGGERYATLPIVAMTALAMSHDAERSSAAGMNDHITKPVEPERLMAVLAKWLSSRAMVQKTPLPRSEVGEIPPELLALHSLNAVEGVRRIGGNPAAYLKQLERFRAHYSNAVEELRVRLEGAGVEAAEAYCHILKGIAGNIGASALLQQVTQLDQILKRGEVPAPEALEQLRVALQTLLGEIDRAAIEAQLAPVAESSSLAIDKRQLDALLEQLAYAIEYDLGAAGGLLERLRSSDAASRWGTEMEEIARLLEVFEVDAALRQLNALRRRGTMAPEG